VLRSFKEGGGWSEEEEEIEEGEKGF